jgi:hypothetical protein
MPREEWKCKCQKQPIQRPKEGHEHLPGPSKETPKTSTQLIKKEKHENLTLFNWMMVYMYVDTLPQPINQGEVVIYFATRPEGALLFTQSTLSCKLWQCPEMEAHVESNPNALSCKRPCIVTRPDVDWALWLWVQQMDQKGEVVNSRTPLAKWEVFGEAMNVPEDKRFPGPGWIQSFCHVHKLKEIQKHGEAGSVDIETVKKEQACIKELLARFQPEDCWNVDESALFAFAPPDCGLSQRQMSGKQASKLEIVQMVQAKVGLARGDIEEIDSDSNDDNPEAVPPPLKEMI